MANSINTNVAAYFAQANISVASNNAASSVSRLSSGNRIVKSSDDVAALSIGTSLQTGVSALKVALTNASQGTSLLQVADGGLSQITAILQRQKAIALQAGSGSLTDSDRSFLDIEFQQLSQQIDSITSSTTFNGLKLFDGSLSTGTIAKADTKQATAASGSISIGDNSSIQSGSDWIINGITLSAVTSSPTGTQFQIGGTAASTISNLKAKLDSLATSGTAAQQKALGGVTYTASDSTLLIKSKSGGTLDSTFTINVSDVNADAVTANAASTKPISVGGQFGGSKVNLLATGFSSATTSVTAASTAAAETPFVDGDNITLTTGKGSATTLYTLVSGDSLTNITNGINARTATTGVSAKLVSSSGIYNIELNYDNSSSDEVALSGGAHFFNASSSGTTSVTHGINTATATFKLFAADQGANATVVTSGSQSATAVFKDTDSLFVALNTRGTSQTFGTASYVALTSFSGLTTLTSIVDAINSNSNTVAKSLGARAVLSGAGSNTNISISFNDSTASNVLGFVAATSVSSTGVIAGTGTYAVDVGGANNANVLNLGRSSINLLTTAAASNATVVASANSATAANGTTTFFKAGDTLSVTVAGLNNGSAITLGTVRDAATIANIATDINASANAALYGIHATASAGQITLSVQDILGKGANPSSITISGGANFVAGATNINTNLNAYTAAAQATTYADASGVSHQTTYALAGGKDDGIGQGSTSATGTVGDNILVELNQTHAHVSLNFPDIADANLTDAANFTSDGTGAISVGGKSFFFSSSPVTADQIKIGSTLKETLDNAVSAINSYAKNVATGDVAYQLNQIKVTRDGNSLVFTAKNLGDVKTITGATGTAISVPAGLTSVTRTNSGLLTNGSNGTTSSYGVDTTGISNAAFTGTISGFKATYSSANTVSLSVKVGDYTYTAEGVATNSTSDHSIRLISDTLDDGSTGGFFDIQLQGNKGLAVADAAGASTFGKRIDSAFSSLTFNQSRSISSYTGDQAIVVDGVGRNGTLVGSKVSAQLPSFDNIKLSDVKVLAPSGSSLDSSISVTIGGVVYKTSAGLGTQLGANQTYRLTNAENANYFIDFTTGNEAIDLSTSAKAAAVQKALGEAFNVNDGSSALSFQIGTTASDSLKVTIGSATTNDLFKGTTLSVDTKEHAEAASLAIDDALSSVTALRAQVGAYQSRFNFASANIQTSVQNQDAARGSLLDTDIATESTSYATSQVKLQAGISVLAQANQQLQALLKLIG